MKMKKILALSCAVAILFSFTGFDWGNSDEQKQEVKKAAAPAPAASTADGLTALNNLLGSGTPAERQAKLDTLVRLSQVMPVMQGGPAPAPAALAATATATPAATKQTTTKKSSRW